MSIENYLDHLKNIQTAFLEFIDEDENDEEKFQNLYYILDNKKIQDNKHDLSLFFTSQFKRINLLNFYKHMYINCEIFFNKIKQIFNINIQFIRKNNDINKKVPIIIQNILIFLIYHVKFI